MTARARLLLRAALALAAVAAGCFETRAPEQPSQTRSAWIPPTTAAILAYDFIAMINERNVAQYRACFTDSGHTRGAFTFTPTAQAAAQFASAFAGWTRESEGEYFLNLTKEVGTDSLAVTSTVSETVSTADSVVYQGAYTIVAQHKRSSVPTTVAGQLQLVMAPEIDNPSVWVIVHWTDLTTGGPSWSVLKGAFLN